MTQEIDKLVEEYKKQKDSPWNYNHTLSWSEAISIGFKAGFLAAKKLQEEKSKKTCTDCEYLKTSALSKHCRNCRQLVNWQKREGGE